MNKRELAATQQYKCTKCHWILQCEIIVNFSSCEFHQKKKDSKGREYIPTYIQTYIFGIGIKSHIQALNVLCESKEHKEHIKGSNFYF